MSANCFVRIIVPKNASSSYGGQYDLRIAGSVPHFGVTVHNPVYSYRTDSKLYIFANGKTEENCSYINDNVDVYEIGFEADISMEEFGAAIDSTITNIQYDVSKQRLTCNLKNSYSSYSYGTTDCFTAIALWCQLLGNNWFINFYNDATGNAYKSYLPLSLRDRYVGLGLWTPMTDPEVIP